MCASHHGTVCVLHAAGRVQARFRLHLLCEDPAGLHLTSHPGYDIARPKEWLRKVAPGLRVVSKAVGMLLGTAANALTGSDMGLGELGTYVDEYVLKEPLQVRCAVPSFRAELYAVGLLLAQDVSHRTTV